MKLHEIGEFELIDRIKQIVAGASDDLVLGIDDDAAVLKSPREKLTLLTTDTLIQDVHFDLSYMSPYEVGWRAMAANLSDIAAMGGQPRYAVVSIAAPPVFEVESILNLYRGMKTLGDEFQTLIIGGDATRSPERLFLSLAVIGDVEENKLALRSAAQVGDAIFVTGSLGGAQAGLKILQSQDLQLKNNFVLSVKRHLTPMPRVKEARFLVEHFPIHAMIDVSDGLASEIQHICRQSEVGALILAERVPLDSETKEAAKLFGEEALDYALTGGEDFELLFTAPQEIAKELQAAFHKQFGFEGTQIGEIKDLASGVNLQHSPHRLTNLVARGFDHFRR